MTTIASDGKTVAADGLLLAGDEPVKLDHFKIERIDDGSIVGFAGSTRWQAPAMKWLQAQCPEDAMPKIPDGQEWDLAVFMPEKVILYRHDTPYPFDYSYPFAIGSGADFAIAALLAGASPIDAVKIAAKCDIRTGGELVSMPIWEPVALREAAE